MFPSREAIFSFRDSGSGGGFLSANCTCFFLPDADVGKAKKFSTDSQGCF